MKNWKNVFDNYPEVDQIYIVDDMPFLRADQAQAHSRATGMAVDTVKRQSKKAPAADKAAADKAAADKAADPDKKKPAKK